MRNNNVTILGTGMYLPNNIITNEDLCHQITTTPEWVEKKLGIKERRITLNESTPDLGYQAGIRALKDANVNKEDLDLIIVVTSSPDKISPSTACTIHSMFDIKNDVPSFDINAVCAGFVYGMSFASTLISSGIYKKILIIASETYSKHMTLDDRNCVFFGDGAGAVVLGTSKNGWTVSSIKSNGNGSGMTGFTMPLTGNFNMIGKEVWEQAVQVLPESIITVLEEANLAVGEIDLLIPHQPSINILKAVAEKIDMSMDKVKVVQHKYGNIAGASIPIALHDAFENNEIKKGDKIVLSAVGAGWAWGSMVINYED
jgi:3-oxoacyl-[acyl-carrier-protein] synthase III